MKLIRCHKCGTVVITEDTFLQNILDAMDAACRKSRQAKSGADRQAWLHQASEYKAIYKSFMHHLTMRDRDDSRYILTEIRNYLQAGNTITIADYQRMCEAGKLRDDNERRREDAEIRRIYGDFESACNRTKASPTEREALKHC